MLGKDSTNKATAAAPPHQHFLKGVNDWEVVATPLILAFGRQRQAWTPE